MTYKKVFIVGIKGVGMANIALVLHEMSVEVAGSDISEEFTTDSELKKRDITVMSSFDASELPHDIDLLIYSGSHGGSKNPQVIEAKKKGIKVLNQAEFLGEWLKLFGISIAVCGTHGKTTTASLIAYLLMKLGKEPSFIIGTSTFNDVSGGAYAKTDYCVIEADEYAVDPPQDLTPKFHHLTPTHILCTSIDFDHPDVFTNLNQTKEEFAKFLKNNARASKNLFLCPDDTASREVMNQLPSGSFFTFGYSPESDFRIANVKTFKGKTEFEFLKNNASLGLFQTHLAGEKILLDVVGALGLLISFGLDVELLRQFLPEFVGAKRRFEHVATEHGIQLYDDYAHHPGEIQATIQAARERFQNKRILIIFQPHTFSRTEALKQELVQALSAADEVFIAPIFPSAREDGSRFLITSRALVDMAKQKDVNTIHAYSTQEELLELLKSRLKPGDVLFTMGAGDIYKTKNDIIDLLKTR